MLIKRELEQIAVQKCPELPEKDIKHSVYVAAVQVLNLKKSGKMLVIDVFERVSFDLRMRFFSDGVNFLLCKECPAKIWLKQIPSDLLLNEYRLSPTDIDAGERDIKRAHEILKKGQESWHYVSGIKNEIDSFARGISRKKHEQAMERKYSKMESHFKMFPAYPDDLAEFCERNVFGYTYIFLSKIQKKKEREAVCGHCGHKFTVSKHEKTGQSGMCPGCNMGARYRGMWTSGRREDKGKICIAHKVQDQLLFQWTNIIRTFDGVKYKYHFYDYYRNLYLHSPKGPVIYAYDYKSMTSWGGGWFRQKNETVHYGKSFIYTNNLREVFGDIYYHVDLEAGLKNAGELSFASLLNNLKTIPAAEYLFKMGMPALAAGIAKDDLGNDTGFSNVLGISKQYLPLYRKFNVRPFEHKIIKASKTWVNESSFIKFRQLNSDPYEAKDIAKILQTMSFERFVNYFSKLKQIGKPKEKFGHYLMLYRDYLSMSETLKVDLSRKSVRFPHNIKEAHDLILPRFNQVKHKDEDKKFKKVVKKIYDGMPGFDKGDYCIVYPALRSDLITEGQSLNICVGGNNYYQNHIAGTQMIFFVREATAPKKPFFTMEIDMDDFRILQLYGFGHRSAPPEVRKFANEFLRALKPLREENRILVTVPA